MTRRDDDIRSSWCQHLMFITIGRCVRCGHYDKRKDTTMDPIEAYRQMTDKDSTIDEQAEHALNLLVWLAKGGHWQGPVTREAAVDQAKSSLDYMLDVVA